MPSIYFETMSTLVVDDIDLLQPNTIKIFDAQPNARICCNISPTIVIKEKIGTSLLDLSTFSVGSNAPAYNNLISTSGLSLLGLSVGSVLTVLKPTSAISVETDLYLKTTPGSLGYTTLIGKLYLQFSLYYV